MSNIVEALRRVAAVEKEIAIELIDDVATRQLKALIPAVKDFDNRGQVGCPQAVFARLDARGIKLLP